MKAASMWRRKEAEFGSVEAVMRLGVCYRAGEGVSRDLRAVCEWRGTVGSLGVWRR
jgi:TPR repeat protein